MNLKRIVSHLGWDGVLLGIAGSVGVVIGILDFTPFLNLTDDSILRMLLSGVGLLLTAMVAQISRRAAEITELSQALGLIEVEVLESGRALPQHLVQNAFRAQRFFLITNLNREVRSAALDKPESKPRQVLDERLTRGDFSLRRMEAISNRDVLENVVRQLLKHEGQPYYIRHYDPPPKSIPTLNIASFDGEHFYLGGFNPTESPTEAQAIYVRHPEIAQFLRDYWNMLWLGAIPLNERKRIDWTELKRISSRIGMTESEFDELIARLKNDVSMADNNSS